MVSPLWQRVLQPDRAFLIAEAGVNHNGSIELACALIDAAKQAGADAVKFQSFKADRLATAGAPKADYQVENTGREESQLEMLRRLELTLGAHRALLAHCRKKRIHFLSTPFDEESADFLDELGLWLFKIPSGEITNLPFLAHVARKGKPIILSTGMSSLAEVRTAVRTIEKAGNRDLVVLHCVSNYPADPADVNLRAMATLEKALGHPAGLSDHTEGIEIPLAAAALGAKVIEKHFTLDRSLPGPDHRASLEPAELTAMVSGIRKIERALGTGKKIPAAAETGTARVARKSLVAAADIARGTVLTPALLAVKRPGTGLAPALAPKLVGRRATRAVPEGTLITMEMFE